MVRKALRLPVNRMATPFSCAVQDNSTRILSSLRARPATTGRVQSTRPRTMRGGSTSIRATFPPCAWPPATIATVSLYALCAQNRTTIGNATNRRRGTPSEAPPFWCLFTLIHTFFIFHLIFLVFHSYLWLRRKATGRRTKFGNRYSRSTIKTKKTFFVLYCSHLFVSLHL